MWQRLVRIKGFTMHDDAEWTVDQVKAAINKLISPKAVTKAHVHEEANPVINCLHWASHPHSFGVTLDLEDVESSVPVVMTYDGPV